jgi:hypothetical protein
MNGFKVFKYYQAIKLHFTSATFNVFVNKGHIKGSYSKFLMRNDHMLFEKMARMFQTDKEVIQFIASNFMYGNQNIVYDLDTAMKYYREFLRRKQSITRVFTDDLDTIVKSGSMYNDFSGQKIPDVIQLLLSNKIALETVVILDDLDSITSRLREGSHIPLILGDDLLRIEKSKGFVKYDPAKIMSPYSQFLEEVKENE